MKVSHLWRYPVKSLQGEALQATEVGVHGVAWDRHWSVLDCATGLVLTARREPTLLYAKAGVVGERVSISLPTGQTVDDDESLSGWLGHPVRLVEATAASPPASYETPTDFEHEDSSPWTTWLGPPGSFHDSTRTMVSIASAASLGNWDPRRFRQNIIVDGADEADLVGRRVRIGSVILDVRKQIDRCVVITRPQPDLARDVEVLRTINRDRAGNLGIGCVVVTAGTVHMGDELAVVDAERAPS